VRDGSYVAAQVPVDERPAARERFFADVLPLAQATVGEANAIAAEHDDFLGAVRGGHAPLVDAAAGAAALEIAARVLDVLECRPFGMRRAATATIPLFPRRKTG
jgi:hypothetical protein